MGLVGVIVAILALVPSFVVLVIGFLPDMSAIWWAGVLLVPLLSVAGLVALALGIIGVIVAKRRRSSAALSITAIVLALVCLAPSVSYLVTAPM